MKEYVDAQVRLIEEMNKLRDQHQAEVSNIKDENIKNAYSTMDKRLEGMNEFRDALKDSNSTFVTWKSLLSLCVGITGFLFGYANYRKNQQATSGSSGKGAVIKSGDQVEVKK